MAGNNSEQSKEGKPLKESVPIDENWPDDMLQVIASVEISKLKPSITPEQLLEHGKMLLERSPAKTGVEDDPA